MDKIVPIVASLDDVPIALRPYYSEREGGGFGLLVEAAPDGTELLNPAALKSTAARERQLRQEAEKAANTRALQLKDLEAKLAELEKKSGGQNKPDDFGAKLAEERTRWEAEITPKLEEQKTAAEAYRKQLDSSIRSSRVASELATAKPDPQWAHLLQRELESVVRLQETKDHKFELVVVDDDGEIRYGSDGKPLTVAARVKEMVADQRYQKAFLGPDASGGGGKASAGGRRGSATVQISAEDARNMKKYQAAKAEAAKLGVELRVVG